MADITVPQLDEHSDQTVSLGFEEMKAQSDRLEREMFAVNRQKAKLAEERRDEDRTTRHIRAQQDEFIASTRRQEDSDTTSRVVEDQDCFLAEQKNIQLSRADQDELLASNRRKEDAGTALRRIGENKEHGIIKLGISQKQSELKSAIESITRQSPAQDGKEAVSKKTVFQTSQEQRLIQDMDNSVREELKQLGMECRPSSDQVLTSERDVPETNPFQAPNSPPSTLVHQEEPSNCQQLQGSIHPSRLQLLAQDSMDVSSPPSKQLQDIIHPSRLQLLAQDAVEVSSSPSNFQQLQDRIHPSRLQLLAHDLVEAASSPSKGTHSTTTNSPQPSRPALTVIPEDSGSLNARVEPSRKRKATSPPRSEGNVSPFLAEKKRVSFDPSNDGTKRSMNCEFQPSLQSSLQPCKNTNESPNQNLVPSLLTGSKPHSGEVGTRDKQLLPGSPTGPKLRLAAVGIPQVDIRCLWGYRQDSGMFNCQSMLILHKREQAHAPATERAQGIYHTLLRPEPARFGQFPVLVCAETGGTYKYVGNYVFGGSRVLHDSEVDVLGEETCRALATSQLMFVPKLGPAVVKTEFFDILIKKGIVRTEREATKTTALDLAKRMKNIKLKPTFTGKPVKKMNTFANRLVFRSFNEDFYTHYFEKNPA
ncbi:hypothetical protein VE03_01628 [Pseudogymnoascus sp. 23342-1-I1]|nr:hypothetical protein VE03_01628 [Pseudogymnoascus sp. 23342-1-I1]